MHATYTYNTFHYTLYNILITHIFENLFEKTIFVDQMEN